MSKERELLKRWFSEFGKIHADIKLLRDTQALLAQPEQTEQEPVAWMVEWVQRYRHNDTPIMDRAVSFTKGDAPAVPNPNYIPLYTSPPTREPLSDAQIAELWGDKHSGKTYMVKNFSRAIEKAHGIGGV